MAIDEVTAPPRSSDGTTHPVWTSAAVVVAYLLLGVTAYWPVLPGISHKALSSDGDFIQSVWFIGWVPHALAHGLNPFFSDAMYAPHGINLAQNTASPLLGLLAAPFTLVLRPLVIVNLLMVVSMPISATAAFVVLRMWRVWWPAAAMGGLIYGFSPYMVGQGVGHPELMFVPLPPFIAMTVVSILQRRGSPRRLGIQFGLLVAAQYLISPEVLAVVAVLTVVGVLCVVVRQPSAVSELARAAAVPVAFAIGVAVILLIYPFWMMFAGPQHFAGPTFPLLNGIHNDTLSFVVHGPMQRVSLGLEPHWEGIMAVSSPTEAGGYIGIPVLILLGFFIWRSRRSPRMQLTTVLFIVAAVLSLGPYLTFDGRATHFPLPFLVLAHLPLLDNILPSRISFEMDACLAAAIAFGLDDVHGGRARDDGVVSSLPESRIRRRKAMIATAATLVVVVSTLLPRWPYATKPVVGLPTRIVHAIPTDDPVAVTYPYADGALGTEPLFWQAADGYRFRVTGGYGYHPDAGGKATVVPNPMRPPELQRFLQRVPERRGHRGTTSSTIPPEVLAATRSALAKYHVGVVIVDRSHPASASVVTLFDQVLGPPKLTVGHFSIWAGWHPVPSR